MPAITVTDIDHDRLQSLLATRVGLAYRAEARRLRLLLRRAAIIRAMDVPSDVVTMCSSVTYFDERIGETRTATLVYPWRASERATLSVLTSIGTALLGLRAGDAITWRLEDGSGTSLRVLGVPYQPEAAGHWHL